MKGKEFMNKKIVAVFMAIALMITMIIPAMAENGDNTGDDNAPCNVTIENSSLLGAYEVGTVKEFKISTYASSSVGIAIIKNIEIKCVSEGTSFSDFQYKDGEAWKDISGYNVEGTLANDVNREVRVTFNSTGRYIIEFTLSYADGTVITVARRYIEVADGAISLYTPSETTTSEVVTDETTTPEPVTDETTTPEVVTDETTTPKDVEVSTTPGADETTVQSVPTTTVKVARVTIKKAEKKKAAKKAKITLKKIKKAMGYQIQISTTKKFKKIAITKNTKKRKNVIIKKLKPGKKYYVRARAYVRVNNQKTFGQWSKIIKIKFKK